MLANVLHHFPPHTAAARADRINIIHCAARFCKMLCETNLERMFLMYFREIPEKHFVQFRRNLNENAYREPMNPLYHCDIKVNDVLYRLDLHMADHRKLIPLQGIRINQDIRKSELITDSQILAALTDLLVAQYCYADNTAN